MGLSLRLKVVLGLVVLAVASIAILATVHRLVVTEQFDRAERLEVERDVLRAVNAIDVQAENLDVLLADWSFWDDSYEFMAGPSPAYDNYVERNLLDDLLPALRLGALIFIDASGEAYYELWEWPSGESAPIQGLEADSPLVRALVQGAQGWEATTGVVRLPNGQPMLASARAILRSDGSGPPRGTMIMAQWLDAEFALSLGASLATPLKFETLASEPRVAELAAQADAIVLLEDGDLNGQALLRDITGEPAFLVETSQRREFSALRDQVLWVSIGAIVVTIAFTGGMIFIGLDLLLLRPMLRIRRELGNLDGSDDDARLTTAGHDETTEVARAVNAMLDRLAESTVEQERLTIAIGEQEEVARTALLEMGEGFLAFDAAGRCQISNPAAARMLKRAPEQIRGHHITELLPSMRTGGTGDGPQVLDVSGRSLAVTRSASLQRGARGGRSVVVLRDVTDILDVERLKQDIIATVSHELRTPLTSIRATVELFQDGEGGALTEVQRRMVTLLSRNTDRLLHIVSDLLALTTLESGAVALRRDESDLAVLVARVVEDMQPLAAASAIDLDADGIEDAAIAWCDEPRIRQVLDNLVQNAIKFSPAGSQVTLRARADGDEVKVSVSDQGPGITGIEQERVFDKFYRTPGSERLPGTGLGLPIARLIVELHGGRIWIESDGTSGTTVHFTVPTPP